MAFAPVFRRPFSATFDRRAAAAGNGLLNALIAYWPGNEASGNLLDAHTNALHLTDANTVTNAAGKVYATARQYTNAQFEYHTRPGDDALLSTGDVDFSLAAWCYLDSKGANRVVAAKWFAAAGAREYMLWFNNAIDRFEFLVRNAGDTANTTVQDSAIGSPSTDTWYLVVTWHDATANKTYLSINNNTPNESAHSGGLPDTTTIFQIGAASITNTWNGRIGPVAMWKSAAGGGGVLTAAQRTALYNGGAGLAYAQFTT